MGKIPNDERKPRKYEKSRKFKRTAMKFIGHSGFSLYRPSVAMLEHKQQVNDKIFMESICNEFAQLKLKQEANRSSFSRKKMLVQINVKE